MSVDFTNFSIVKIDTGYQVNLRNNGSIDVAELFNGNNASLQIDLQNPVLDFSTGETLSLTASNVTIGEKTIPEEKKPSVPNKKLQKLETEIATVTEERNSLTTALAEMKSDKEKQALELENKISELEKQTLEFENKISELNALLEAATAPTNINNEPDNKNTNNQEDNDKENEQDA